MSEHSDSVASPPPPPPGGLWSFLRKNLRDILIWCALLAAFRVVPYVIQGLDATSAVSDFGMVHVLVYGSLGTSFAVLTVWLIFHFSFPTLGSHLDEGKFREDFAAMQPGHRVFLIVIVMALLMWTFVKITALGAGGGA